jgi:aminopeptidase N
MEFDEKFYDREYDLDNLIMVGVPDFNAGAMENKGLMVFNSPALLVHPDSGTDAQFRGVAHTVMHEYAHNYSGNRVTVKYFYEAALKEGYTDARAQHFSEWLFGQDFIRPKDVLRLQEAAHPQMMSKDKSHPVNGDSYIDSFELYDGITYINGREIFRLGKELLDSERPELFREAQNAYFDRFDNQAVTFEQYMGVLREFSGRDLDAYERWFEQEGVPQVQAQLLTEENGNLTLLLEQSCPHPKTGDAQKPFHIPINVELIDRDGTVIKPKELIHLTEERLEVSLGSAESADQPIPVLLHGYTAPIRLNYDYSLEALEIIISHVDDAYCQWKACRDYQRIIIRDAMQQLANGVDPSEIQWKEGLVETYKKALTNPKLPVLAKARLLSFPTLRQVVGGDEEYDFVAAAEARRALSKFLAGALKEELRTELLQNPAPSDYDPYHPDFTKHMELREFQGCALGLLAKNKEQDFLGRLFELMQHSQTFQDYSQIVGILSNDAEWGPKALDHYADRWQHDLDNFNRWIALQANSSEACPESLNTALEHPAFKRENPNHIRSLVRGFINNLDCYHKADGSGYAWVVDRILEVEKTNEGLALGYFCRGAFIDYAHMKPAQQALMMEQAKRLANESQSDPIQAFAKRFIEQYAG